MSSLPSEASSKKEQDTKEGLQDTSIGAAETQKPDSEQKQEIEKGAESAAVRGGPKSTNKRPKAAELVDAAESTT